MFKPISDIKFQSKIIIIIIIEKECKVPIRRFTLLKQPYSSDVSITPGRLLLQNIVYIFGMLVPLTDVRKMHEMLFLAMLT